MRDQERQYPCWWVGFLVADSPSPCREYLAEAVRAKSVFMPREFRVAKVRCVRTRIVAAMVLS